MRSGRRRARRENVRIHRPNVKCQGLNQAAAELFGVDVAEELEIGGKTD